jgi:hypothetical protein
MDMKTIQYRFHTEWCEDAGQFYAHRHDFDRVSDARNAHRAALAFDWANGKQRPSVSDLYAVTIDKDETTGRTSVFGTDPIQDGARRQSRQSVM